MIDNALRQVSMERGVEVRLIVSWWNHSRPDLPNYLSSLQALSGVMNATIQVVGYCVYTFINNPYNYNVSL